MRINYDWIPGLGKPGNELRNGPRKRLLLSLLTIASVLLSVTGMKAQTLILDPNGEGGFENPGPNGWTFANGSNFWIIGAAAGVNPTAGSKAAYVTNNGTAYAYATTAGQTVYSWMYRDFTVTGSETKYTLEFDWKKPSIDTNDRLFVCLVPTTVTPTTAGTSLSPLVSSVADTAPGFNTGQNYVNLLRLGTVNTVNWVTEKVVLPKHMTENGKSFRLVFGWTHNGATTGTAPASVDNVKLTAVTPTSPVTSTTTGGSWSIGSTWVGGNVPTWGEDVVIDGPVIMNATYTYVGDLTINPGKTLNFVSTIYRAYLNVFGDFTNNGTYVGHVVVAGERGKLTMLHGNLTNNGVMDFANIAPNSPTSELHLCGFSPQTISGNAFGTTASRNFVNRIAFTNMYTDSYPNVTWSIDQTVVKYLTFGHPNLPPSRVKLGSGATNYTMYLGNNTFTADGSALTYNVTGSGFLPGAKLSRYFAAGGTGSSIPAIPGAPPSGNGGRFPFVTEDGDDRSFYINRNTGQPVEQMDITYTHHTTSQTSDVLITDGGWTVNKRYNGFWTVTTATQGSPTYKVAAMATNGLYTNYNDGRLIYEASAIPGTLHLYGTTAPCVKRSLLDKNLLTAEPLYAGIGSVRAGHITGEQTVCAYRPQTIYNDPAVTNFTRLSLVNNTPIAAPVVVKWYKSLTGDPGSWGSPINQYNHTHPFITGYNTGELVAINLITTTWFKAIVSNGGSSEETPAVKITVTRTIAGTITAMTNGMTTTSVCVNGDITFTLNGYEGNSIQWQLSTTPYPKDFKNIDGEINDTFTMNNIPETYRFWVRAVVSTGCTTATTAPKGIRVNGVTVIHHPGCVVASSYVICPNSDALVSITGPSSHGFQWLYSEDDGTNWNPVPPRNDLSHVLDTFPNSVSYSNGGNVYRANNIIRDVQFKAIATYGQCGLQETNVVKIKVTNTAVAGTISTAASLPLCYGTGAILQLTGHTGNVIQWEKLVREPSPHWQGIGPPAAADFTSIPTGVLYEDTTYRATISIRHYGALLEPCDTATTEEFTVTVHPRATPGSVTPSVSSPSGTSEHFAICTDNLSKRLTMGSYTADTKQWQTIVSATNPSPIDTGWKDIEGATEDFYIITDPKVGGNWFRVKLVKGTGCKPAYTSSRFVWYKSCSGKSVTSEVTEAVAAPFTVAANPNPYNTHFSLNVVTTSEANIGLSVYDMTGRLLERREVARADISTMTFGELYPSGVYIIIVTQDNAVRTLRMIKR